MKNQLIFLSVISLFLLNACTTVPIVASTAPEESLIPIISVPSAPSTSISPILGISPAITSKSILKAADWSALHGWRDDDISLAWGAFLQSCVVLKNQSLWQEICTEAMSMEQPDNKMLREFFESRLTPYQVLNLDGNEDGLITGYYEPLLKGSRKPSSQFPYPVYRAPDELLTIDLSEIYPELKGMRLRGRLQGRKVLPYYSRSEIENPASNSVKSLQGYELLWVENAVELFFLQIQGSGRVKLENGDIIKIGYSEQNGHPYRSIGKILIGRGELAPEKASMQGIKEWGFRNPNRLNELLQQNPSYVLFRDLPAGLSGPLGALGVPLTAGRSLAIDPVAIPQGAPIFLATTWPNSHKQLRRLMMAQDTGGAIKGGVRADFFWGFGPEAANQAGKMKQIGKIWVLMPNDYIPKSEN